MSIRDRLFAAVFDKVMAPMEEAGLAAWRAEVMADLAGTVVDIGSGTGANLAHVPPTVDRLILTDPSAPMLEHLRARLDEVPDGVDVEVVRAPATSLPLGDGEADAVTSMLVLCSVPDVQAVLAEVRRVLKPGGTFAFIEHVAADDKPDRLRWQRRADHVWPHVAGGCRLTRRTGDDIAAAGFEVDDLTRESARKAFPLVRTMIRGRAISPT